MTKIKICGIRNQETVDTCRELSIDFIGFNFSPNSPRNIQPKFLNQLLKDKQSPNFPQLVFLFFMNESDEIKSLVDEYNPDFIQLIDGDPTDLKDIWDQYRSEKKLLPAFRVKKKIEVESNLTLELPLVILDSFKENLGGGTGHTFPLEYVKDVKRPFLLAGGITPLNVHEAIDYIHPYGIDVASGVETDGMKDSKKIRELVKNVRGD